MKTPIRWAGSKKALLSELREHWSAKSSRYVEPFCGSACLFFDIEPDKAILGDINGELITAYKAIRRNPRRVSRILRRIPKTKASYYAKRAISPQSLSDEHVAARFIFLNRFCFNGIYRTNLNGEFNVPYARPKERVIFRIETIKKMSTLLKRTVLLNADFEEVLKKVKRGDFVYLDPPYAVANRRIFSEYHPDTFSKRDLKRLKHALRKLDRRGAHFVVSYADSSEGRSLLSRWNPKRIRTRRNIAGFAGHRRIAYELIASTSIHRLWTPWHWHVSEKDCP
jgi:DNA adenine methylase